jgi:hypothetical protein
MRSGRAANRCSHSGVSMPQADEALSELRRPGWRPAEWREYEVRMEFESQIQYGSQMVNRPEYCAVSMP